MPEPREPCFRELLARTITTNLLDDRYPNRGLPSVKTWCAALDAIDERDHKDPDCTAWNSYKSSMAKFVSEMLFLITKEGLLGLGPANSRQGLLPPSVFVSCFQRYPQLTNPNGVPSQTTWSWSC